MSEITTNNKELKSRLFTVKIRKGTGGLAQFNFEAKNEKEANEKTTAFCKKHGFRHVFTKPFLTDLDSWKNI